MDNKYTGEVEIQINGETKTVIYDWRALAKVQSEMGAEILKSIFDLDPEATAKILVVGLNKRHPEITVDDILDASPPLFHMKSAIDKALGYAYFGPQTAAEHTADLGSDSAGEAGETDTEKKTP